LIYFKELINRNVYFMDNIQNNKFYNQLSSRQKEIIFNLSINEGQYGWRDYKEVFGDPRSKQQLINDFNTLVKYDFLSFEVYKNNLKRFYLKRNLSDYLNK
jgi:hypothetical protein